MNKKQILASLNKIANELDNTGMHEEYKTYHDEDLFRDDEK